jgi:hypothetical protein
MSRSAVNGWIIRATGCRAAGFTCARNYSEIAIGVRSKQEVTGRMATYRARSRITFERREGHAQRLEPHTDPPSFSQGPGIVPALTLADGDEFRLDLEGALDQVILNRGGTDASPDCNRDAGPGSVPEFRQFEQGAGNQHHR